MTYDQKRSSARKEQAHPLDLLIAEGESNHQDFKFHVSDTQKIAKTLVAFANTQGGRLLLGVKDNGKVIGVESDEEQYMIETAATFFCNPQVPYKLQEWKYDEKTVLSVDIPPSMEKPHYAKNEESKWRVYVRVRDTNKYANRVIVEVLKRKGKGVNTVIHYTQKENQLLSFLNENDLITFKQLMRLIKVKPRHAENILINLIAVGVVAINHNDRSFYYTLKANGPNPMDRVF
jgi:predicted HTH transcriptional regulator